MSPNAIIIGGSRGIGLAIGKKFLQCCFNVTLVSRNQDNLIKSTEILKHYATQNQMHNALVNYQVCDISVENDINKTCQNLIHFCNQKNEKIDVLINSAGITYNKLLISSKLEDINKVLNTNLVGTMLFTKVLCKQMIKQKKGSIINIGSIIGSNGNTGQTIYSASKAGLVGFTKSLAKELGPKNICVNLVAPGLIETDMTSSTMSPEQLKKYETIIPLQRIGLPEEVANAAYFLGTSSFITGSILVVDGGLSLMF